MTLTMPSVQDQIFEFVKSHYPETMWDDVRNVIEQHWLFGTIDVVTRGDEIIAVCRWNIVDSGRVCFVLDLFIKPGEPGFRVMKHLIARNWHRFPHVRYIKFARTRKYPGRKEHMYTIKSLLSLKEGVNVR